MLSKKAWQPELVMMFIASLLACFCFVSIIASLLHGHVAGFKNSEDVGFLLCGTLGIHGVILVLMAVFLRLHEISWREALGLNNPDWKKSLAQAVVVFALALPLMWLLQFLSVAILTKLGHPPEKEAAVAMFLGAKTIWAQGYFALFAVVIAPMAEEFFFRGLLFPFLKQMGWTKTAWFGVSFLFALIHLGAAVFVPLFVFALMLTWLYNKTNCLLASMFVHSLFNLTNLILLFLAAKYGDAFRIQP